MFAVTRFRCTVEPRYNEPLYSEVIGITNDFPGHSNTDVVKFTEKNLDTTKLRYREHILPIPWPCVI